LACSLQLLLLLFASPLDLNIFFLFFLPHLRVAAGDDTSSLHVIGPHTQRHYLERPTVLCHPPLLFGSFLVEPNPPRRRVRRASVHDSTRVGVGQSGVGGGGQPDHRWMTQLRSGDTLGVACALVPDLLGFWVSSGGGAYGVSDGGRVMFRSMVLPSPSF
jgi:hypothetical protein